MGAHACICMLFNFKLNSRNFIEFFTFVCFDFALNDLPIAPFDADFTLVLGGVEDDDERAVDEVESDGLVT